MPSQPFLALITPIGDTGGGGGGGSPPLGIWGGSNQPFPGYGPVAPQPSPGWPPVAMPPIYYPPTGGTPPLGIWGGSGVGDYIDAGFPGPQPGIDNTLPGNQPGLWPGKPPYMDIGFPGPQPGGGRPTHPIYYPPVIWDPARPANPIVNPGDPDHPGGDRTPKIEWKTAWSPSTGWIVVGVPTGETVTPSSGGGAASPAQPKK